MTIRWGTAADVEAFCGAVLPATGRVRVAELGGEVVGMVGWYRLGEMAFVFSKVTPVMKRFPRVILREARAMLASLRMPAVCEADPDEAGAPRLLTRLGWVKAGETQGREVFAWRN